MHTTLAAVSPHMSSTAFQVGKNLPLFLALFVAVALVGTLLKRIFRRPAAI